MRIVYCGSGEFGIPCLDALQASRHGIVHVFTQPSQPAGRGRHSRPTPVARWAAGNGIEASEAVDINERDIIRQVEDMEPDLLVVIAFGQKLGNDLVRIPARGAINVHASLLPMYRGAAPINWAIIEGKSRTGVSVITLAQRMDAGEILGQARTDIGRDETAGQLHDRLAELSAPLLLKVIDEIESGTAAYKPQNAARVSRAPKLKKSDGVIDWRQDSEAIRNRIRGLWPWPGAQALYCNRRGKSWKVTIARTAVADRRESELAPGTLDEELNVVCGSGALRILELKPAGGHLMDFQSFANGRNVGPGDMFRPIDETCQ